MSNSHINFKLFLETCIPSVYDVCQKYLLFDGWDFFFKKMFNLICCEVTEGFMRHLWTYNILSTQILKSGAAIPHLDKAGAIILSDSDETAGCVEAKLHYESKTLLEETVMKRDDGASRLVWLVFITHQWNETRCFNRAWEMFSFPEFSLLSLQVDIFINAGVCFNGERPWRTLQASLPSAAASNFIIIA